MAIPFKVFSITLTFTTVKSIMVEIKSKHLFLSIVAIIANYAASVESTEKLNERPIIAVLTQRYPKLSNQSCLAASYVKFLESAGARVVPIPHYFSREKVAQLFKYVNGVLYPGGDISWFISEYYKHAEHFWDMAIEANDRGDFFPIWGTCLGFETMNIIRTKKVVTSPRVASDVANTLEFTTNANRTRLVRAIPKDIFNALSTENITYNHHNYGISPETFEENPKLKDFFDIISLNKGVHGETYISTFEAKRYPFYGVQWHPEKPNFEMGTHFENIPHTANAIRAAQYMANFFVNEARKNGHKFPSKKMEDEYLIYRYNPVHTAHVFKTGPLSDFEQCYIFKDKSEIPSSDGNNDR